jgi:hypothetical protein
MTLLINNDPKVQKFLQPLLEHVEKLLVKKKLKKLVLVITDIATREALERWQFDIETTADIELIIFSLNIIKKWFSIFPVKIVRYVKKRSG